MSSLDLPIDLAIPPTEIDIRSRRIVCKHRESRSFTSIPCSECHRVPKQFPPLLSSAAAMGPWKFCRGLRRCCCLCLVLVGGQPFSAWIVLRVFFLASVSVYLCLRLPGSLDARRQLDARRNRRADKREQIGPRGCLKRSLTRPNQAAAEKIER